MCSADMAFILGPNCIVGLADAATTSQLMDLDKETAEYRAYLAPQTQAAQVRE